MEPQVTNKIPVACHAPALTDEMIAKYKAIIAELPLSMAEIKDAMQTCMTCIEKWWQLPVSTLRGSRFVSPVMKDKNGKAQEFDITPLEPVHITELDSVTPWMRECVAIRSLFDTLPAGVREESYTEDGRIKSRNVVVDQKAFDLCNAAHHLIWYVQEITLDREPLSQDVLKG